MANKGSGWIKWVLALVILAAAGYFYMHWKKPGVTALAFRTGAVQKGDIRQIVTASGTTEPVVFVEVGTEISGRLERIYVDFNTVVTNGQVLAQIDPRSYDNALRQAEAELASAKASLELAQVNAKRAEELHRQKLMSDSEYDTTIADLHRAEATALIREATRDKTKVDLDRTTVYSPIDGVVISRNVEVGQTVAASLNAPTLFLIANDLSKMHIHAAISEADIGGVEEGQKVEFLADAFMELKLTGTVIQVRNAPVTNQNVVSYTSIIAFDNPDSKLKPGMTVNVSIVRAERTGILRVPNAATRFKPPEGVEVEGAPSQAPTESAPETAEAGGGRRGEGGGGGFGGGGGGPGGGRGGRGAMDPEQQRQFMARFDKNGDGQIDESERAAMRAQFGGGRGGGRRGGGNTSQPAERGVYLSTKQADATGKEITVLKYAKVKTGITDGAFTEVIDGLTEGDLVVVGTELPGAAAANTARDNPFSPMRRGR